MQPPDRLMFVRQLDCTATIPISDCVNTIRHFQPTLKAEVQVSIHNMDFVIVYGADFQLKIWASGTLESLDADTTRMVARIGVDRQQSNLKAVVGISVVVWMMAVVHGLSEELAWDSVLTVGGVIFVGFWIILIGGMAYSQHRLRQDMSRLFCQRP